VGDLGLGDDPPRAGLDIARADQIVRRIDARARAVSVRPYAATASAVWEVVCADGRGLVVKTFRPDHPWQMAHECLVYDLIARRTTVPVPDVLLQDDTRVLLPRDFIVMDRVEGTPVIELPHLAPADVVAIYLAMGRMLGSLHEAEFEAFGYLFPSGVEPPLTNAEFMAQRFAEQLRVFNDHGGPAVLAERIERTIASSRSLVDEARPAVLCHCDVHEANVLVTRNDGSWRVAGVVDVGGAVAGARLFDVARTHYWSAQGDTLKQSALLDGYGLSFDSCPDQLRLYSLYHALELRNWFARHDQPEWLARTTRHLEELSRPFA
jgi:Ser/Thr protein kinase RdoA (MazF antagonist)